MKSQDHWKGFAPIWPMKRLKYVAPSHAARADASPADPEYVGLENVESWTGRLLENPGESLTEDAGEITSTASRFIPGDVLFGKLRPYLAKAFVAERQGVCSTEFLVLRPHADVDGRYLRYFLLCPEVVSLIDSSTFGAKMPRANWDFIGGIRVPVPNAAVQRRIVEFLDTQTAEIDALISEKERMLTLLEEKRTAVVAHAVIRGLDSTTPLKPSGLDWVGDVPKHWDVPRLKRLFTIRDERSALGEEELLTVSHITGVTSRSEKTVYMFRAEDMSGYKHCFPGDVVVNTLWAFMGAMGVAWQEGIVSPDYHVYRPTQPLVSKYIDFVCRSSPFRIAVLRQSKGVWTSRLRLYPEEFFNIRFPFPPYSEQQALVSHFDERFGRDQLLKDQLSKSLELLRERRSAVTTAAVTGQIPLEEMAE